MSISKIKDKIEMRSILPVILVIGILIICTLIISCKKTEQPTYNIIVNEEKTNTTEEANEVPSEPAATEIPEQPEVPENDTITIIVNSTAGNEEQANEGANEAVLPDDENIKVNPNLNAVEFYFLMKGKAYLRYTLYEEQSKTFDFSGTTVTVEPTFIANDSVIFKVDNYTTKAIGLREWYSEDGFEIYVNYIYYRG